MGAHYGSLQLRSSQVIHQATAAWSSNGRVVGLPRAYLSSRNVSTSRPIYAEMLSAVKTDTTLPLVRNFFRCSPSSPTSEKNCLFPGKL